MSSITASFVRPRPVAWLFFIGAMVVTVGLGTWQVQRLAWKEGLIAEIHDAGLRNPITQLPADAATLQQNDFARVKLKGSWLSEPEFHLAPRYYRSKFGYAIISPFKLADGRIVLVNRGWVPAAQKALETRPDTAVRGKAAIDGMIRTGAERSYFTPANSATKNIWFGRDVADMAASAKLENVVPAMVDLVGAQDAKKLPIPSDGTIRVKNDHLSYIITWYGIALGILVIFVTYHRKKA